MSRKDSFFLIFKFILPVGLWIFLFRSVLLGEASISGENFLTYSIVKFYLDNLQTGVYPLWNPYLFWGIPDHITLINIGTFNPIWFLTFFLNKVGMRFYTAYLMTIVTYFFIGQLGFYQLVKAILRNSIAAYMAFVALTFSSLSIPLFAQLIMLIIFVPSVWFFYFLVRFCQNWDKRYFVGIVFCLMIISTTYLPFYFLTVFLTVIFLFAIIYFSMFKGILIEWFKFLRKNLILSFISLVIIILSLWPAYQSYRMVAEHEVIVPFRYGAPTDVYKKGLTLTFKGTTDGAMSARMLADDLFSNLNQISYGNDGFFYVTTFLYLIACLAALSQFNRLVVLLVFLTLILFLLAISNAAPLHQFMFNYVFYFKLFRNLHYFMPFLLASFILLVAEQLRILLENKGTLAQLRWLNMAFIFAVHLGWIAFLATRENVICSSYLTIVISLLFFLFYFLKQGKMNEKLFILVLFLGMVVQPIEVFSWHNAKAKNYKSGVIKKCTQLPSVKPVFSFIRPLEHVRKGIDKNLKVDPSQNFFYMYRVSMVDSPVFFMPYEYGFLTYWSYYLSKNGPKEYIQIYTRNKFLVYDGVEVLDRPEMHLNTMKLVLLNNRNVAIIAADQESTHDPRLLSLIKEGSNLKMSHAAVIDSPSEQFKIKHFDVNSIKIETNFVTPKFLVYNDSYQSDWQAFVNGKRVPLYRANIAFKGIAIPAGKNEIYLRYHPLGGQYIYFFLLVVFGIVFLYLITSLTINRRRTREIYG